MSAVATERLRKIAIAGGVVAVVLAGAAAGVTNFLKPPVQNAVDWPGPARPWRAVEDAKLARGIAEVDRRLTLRAVWRCDAAACGFEGRYLVLTPVDPEQAEAIDSTLLEYLLGALAKPQAGDVAWPAMPDGQAQAFRLPGGPAFVLAQSDREAGAAKSMVAGAAIDQVVAARFPDARPAPPPPPAPTSGKPAAGAKPAAR